MISFLMRGGGFFAASFFKNKLSNFDYQKMINATLWQSSHLPLHR